MTEGKKNIWECDLRESQQATTEAWPLYRLMWVEIEVSTSLVRGRQYLPQPVVPYRGEGVMLWKNVMFHGGKSWLGWLALNFWGRPDELWVTTTEMALGQSAKYSEHLILTYKLYVLQWKQGLPKGTVYLIAYSKLQSGDLLFFTMKIKIMVFHWLVLIEYLR